MQYILFWYSTWFILGINPCIPPDWNGLRSLLLLPATCNFWCSTSIVKAPSCKVPKTFGMMEVRQPRGGTVISAQVKLLLGFNILPQSAGSYVVSSPPPPIFFCVAFKELHIRLKGDCLFFLWVRQGTTEGDSGQRSTGFRMAFCPVFRPHSCTHVKSQCDLPNQDKPLLLLIQDYIYEINCSKNQ